MVKMILTGLVVAAVALLGVTVEAALDRRWPDRNETVFIVVITGGLAIVGAATVIHFGRFF